MRGVRRILAHMATNLLEIHDFNVGRDLVQPLSKAKKAHPPTIVPAGFERFRAADDAGAGSVIRPARRRAQIET